MSEHGFSDTGSTCTKEVVPSSSSLHSLKVDHEGEIAVLKTNLNEHNEGELLEYNKDIVEKEGCSSSQPFEVSQAYKEYSLNRQAVVDSKDYEVAPGSVKLAKNGEQFSDSLGPENTSEEDVVDLKQDDNFDDTLKSSTTNSSHTYEGGISSSDDGKKDHAFNLSIPKSRRTFRNRLDKNKGKEKEEDALGHHMRSEIQTRSLSSESSDGTDDSDVLQIFNALKKENSSKYESVGVGQSFDSIEYRSARSWLELEKDELSRSETKGSALISDMELLRKIDELRDALAMFVQIEGTRFSRLRSLRDAQHFDQQPIVNLLHHAHNASYGQLSSSSGQSWPSPFSGAAPCSCLHCQEERKKQFRFNGSDVGSNSSPGGSLHGSEKASIKEKRRRHCRPVSRAAPFVICYNCMTLLQLPADFLISRKKLHKLKCGSCKEVLVLTFPGRSSSIPRTPSEVIHSLAEVGETSGGNAAISEEKGEDSPRLHRLMGYDSARELLYNHSDIDEGFDISVSASLHSYKLSYGSPVNNKTQGTGSARSALDF